MQLVQAPLNNNCYSLLLLQSLGTCIQLPNLPLPFLQILYFLLLLLLPLTILPLLKQPSRVGKQLLNLVTLVVLLAPLLQLILQVGARLLSLRNSLRALGYCLLYLLTSNLLITLVRCSKIYLSLVSTTKGQQTIL